MSDSDRPYRLQASETFHITPVLKRVEIFDPLAVFLFASQAHMPGGGKFGFGGTIVPTGKPGGPAAAAGGRQ
jgi:hypothetical protein